MRRLIWMFIVIDIADGVDSDDKNDHDNDTNNDGNRMEMKLVGPTNATTMNACLMIMTMTDNDEHDS